MWSDGVVVLSPDLESASGVCHTGKPVLVEALVADLAVETLDVRVLGGFTRSDKVETDAMPVGPLVQCLAAEFGTIVDQQRNRRPVTGNEPIEDSADTQARQRGVHLIGQTAAAEVIQDVEDANAPAIGQLVRHEIHRPSLIEGGGGHRLSTSVLRPATFAALRDL